MNQVEGAISEASCLSLFHALSDAPDLSQALEAVVTEALKRVPYDGILVSLIDESQDNLICHWITLPADYDSYRSSFLYYRFPLESDDLNALCYKSGKPLLADSEAVEQSSGATRVRFKRWNMKSLGIVPIRASPDSRPFGTVMVLSNDRPVGESDIAFLQELFGFAAKRIQTGKRQEELFQHERENLAAGLEQKEFLKFVNRINSLESYDEIFLQISREFLRRFPIQYVSIWLKEGDQAVCKATTAVDPDCLPIAERLREYYATTSFENKEFESTVSEVLLQNSPMYIEDVAKIRHLPMDPKVAHILDIIGTPRTFIHTPIWHKERPLGVMTLVSSREVFKPTDAEFRIIELLSTFLGTLMENANLYETIKRQQELVETLNAQLSTEVTNLGERALKDQLTGLYNFGFFHDSLARRVNEFLRKPESTLLSLIIFDIDHFKRLNDTYGHPIGNVVIQEVAKRLMTRARKTDIACRFGGEEFAMILPACNLENARNFAEGIRTWINDEPVMTTAGALAFTISAGCAVCVAGDTEALFLERADQALYRAKQGGRNRVES
ncbi:hypothetical protein BH11PSE11_BH11PSE11_26270 [soil metagenome]